MFGRDEKLRSYEYSFHTYDFIQLEINLLINLIVVINILQEVSTLKISLNFTSYLT